MTTETYDNKPKFDPNKSFVPVNEKPPFDSSKPHEEIKKKESGTSGLTAGLTDATTGLKYFDIPQQQVDKALNMGKNPMEHTEPTEEDPIGKILSPARKEAGEKFSNALTAINNAKSESVNQKQVSPLRQTQKTFEQNEHVRMDQNALNTFNLHKENVEHQLIPEAQTATNALVSYGKNKGVDIPINNDGIADLTPEVLSKLPKNNETVQALVKRVNEYNGVKQDLNTEGGHLTDAAILGYVKENPFFGEQLSKMQDEKGNSYQDAIPPILRGRIIDWYLKNPNVKLAASKDPYSQAEYEDLSKNLLTKIPEYGANIVGNELSKAIESAGKNNALYNPNFARGRKDYIDNLAHQMYANDPQRLQLYNDIVSKDLGKYIDTPGLLEHGEAGMKNALKGQLNSVEQWLGIKSPGENIYNTLKEQSEQTSAEGKGLHAVAPIAGDLGGLVLENILGGKALKGLGLVPDAATAGTITNLATFYGDEKQKADAEYAGDQNKSVPKAALMSLLYNNASHLIPSKQLTGLLEKASPEVDDIVKQLADGTITKEAAKDATTNIFSKLLSSGAEIVKKTGQAALENMAITATSNAADRVLNMNPEQFGQSHPSSEMIDAAKVGVFGTILPNVLAVAGDRNTAKNNLYDSVLNPEGSKKILDQQAMVDPDIAKTVEEKKGLIDYLANVKQTLDEHQIPIKDQKSYLLQSAAEQAINRKIESTADPVIQKKYKDELKKVQEVKEGIFKGIPEEEVKTTADQKAEDEQAKASDEKMKEEADRNKLIEKGHTAIQKLLDEKDEEDKPVFKGIYRDIAKSNPIDFLQDVAGQINGVQRKDGDNVKSDQLLSDLEHSLIKKYGADVVNVAKELFPYKEPVSNKVSVEMPEEIENKRRNIITFAPKENINESIKPEEDAIQESKASSVLQHTQEGIGEQGSGRERMEPSLKGDETTGTSIQPEESKNTGKEEVANDLPFGEHDKASLKNAVSEVKRWERGLPKVDLPKMGSDIQTIAEGKQLVDSGEIDPRQLVAKFNEANGKIGMQPDEAKAMLYYMHQLNVHDTDLRKQLATTENEGEKDNIRGQLLQLDDEIDAATRANQLAGTPWGQVGNIRQIVVDTGFNPSREKSVIKEVYGGEIPKDVQLKIDTALKERDKAIEERDKLEDQLKNKQAQENVAAMKKPAPREKKDYKAKRADLLDELKKAKEEHEQYLKDQGIQKQGISGFTLTPKMIKVIGKLAATYVEEGVEKLSDLIGKIHEDVKGFLPEIAKQDIRDAIALHEAEKKNKSAEGKEEKIATGQVKPDQSKLKLKFQNNTEWVKANQRIANADFKIKSIKRQAFESKKNWYQRGLMWAGRGFRLAILSGYNVLGKLASAATIGSAVKRVPEQLIGSVYSQAFKGIANKAPIEGYLNAKSEAKFYKEFFDPKKFAHNSWEILKTGVSDLSKKYGGAEYEHIPVIYLPTDLHQIIKDPVKRSTFESSFRNGLIHAEKNGLDINDPLVINSIENAAYKRAQYEIFQEQNWLSKKFTAWKADMEKKGNVGATGKFVADFLIPVSTVPTNIVRRVTTTSPLGLIRGSKMVVDAYRKGIENLSNEEADAVMKQLKQGTLGTALWLVGWFGYSSFGGLYSKYNPAKKKNEDDLIHDEMEVGGKRIPKPVQHALPLEIIQTAATARRIFENYVKKKNENVVSASFNSALGSIGAMTEQIPIVETGTHVVESLKNPSEGKKLKEDMVRRVEPQILRETGVIPTKNPKKH